jgi:phosphopantothenate---cysteine ligase (CTP)
MRCLVTAGPTFEPLDAVRRLTNLSTGRLGSELANFLVSRGHQVVLLLSEQATWHGEHRAGRVQPFSTTASLRTALQTFAAEPPQALFHAAAVSDFTFGRVWRRGFQNELVEVRSGKFQTSQGPLLAELVPTAKILAELRGWFPRARLVGWKYEVDGGRDDVIELARRQIREFRTDVCVTNGPAYGAGFGFVRTEGLPVHVADSASLFDALERWLGA